MPSKKKPADTTSIERTVEELLAISARLKAKAVVTAKELESLAGQIQEAGDRLREQQDRTRRQDKRGN